jgi:hypothetical protein
VLLSDLQGGFFGLADLSRSVPARQSGRVAAGFPAHGSGPLLILAGVRSDVGEDTERHNVSPIRSILEAVMKRAALYMRVSTVDQHPETQWVPEQSRNLSRDHG